LRPILAQPAASTWSCARPRSSRSPRSRSAGYFVTPTIVPGWKSARKRRLEQARSLGSLLRAEPFGADRRLVGNARGSASNHGIQGATLGHHFTSIKMNGSRRACCSGSTFEALDPQARGPRTGFVAIDRLRRGTAARDRSGRGARDEPLPDATVPRLEHGERCTSSAARAATSCAIPARRHRSPGPTWVAEMRDDHGVHLTHDEERGIVAYLVSVSSR